MWEHQSHEITKFKDIQIKENRHPVLKQLEAAFLNQKPKNPLYFIKKWSQQQLKEAHSSEDEQEELKNEQLKQSKKSKKVNHVQLKRRNAIVMAQSQETEQWVIFLNKQPLLKNEECKSRIMISLRQIPFLVNLGWDDINQLVEEAQIREFYKNQIFVSKGQTINRLYILIHGEIAINDYNKNIEYAEGQSLFVESIISLINAKYNFYVASQKAWICGIQSFRIYQLIQSASKKRQQFYEKILMAIGLFNCLDRQQFYKLYCLVHLLQVKKPNQIIIQQNDPVDRLYLVLKGEFIFCRKSLGGDITSYQTYREGHYFGEEWIIKPVQSQVMVVAKTDGLLGVISRKDVEECISSIDRLLLRKKAKKIQNY